MSGPAAHRANPASYTVLHVNDELLFVAASAALIVLVGVVLAFGAKRALVAAEVFFLFGAWAGLRAARLLGG
jgi:hypothetical protein